MMRPLALSVVMLLAACGDSGSAGGGGAGGTSQTGFGGLGESFCGDEEHEPLQTKPLIYFVLDGSGSMFLEYEGEYRYVLVAEGADEIVKDLKNLIRVGATIFPGPGQDVCAPGDEVFAPQVPEDPQEFTDALFEVWGGGTPVAATLAVVRQRLSGEEGPIAVVLLTDGGPNCNGDLMCDAATCTLNVEGTCADVGCCGQNCCEGVPQACVDHQDMLDEIGALADAGRPVYVVGIPGSEEYSTLLGVAAIAGGTDKPTGEKYYRVDELDKINKVFREIAASLIECRVGLASPPDAPEKTNVYFDTKVVFSDPVDGWQWESDAHDAIVFNGESCATLRGGHVSTIRVLSGCPTEVPK